MQKKYRFFFLFSFFFFLIELYFLFINSSFASVDPFFLNNTTTLFSNNPVVNSGSQNIPIKQSILYGEESIFYIWKAKK